MRKYQDILTGTEKGEKTSETEQNKVSHVKGEIEESILQCR